MFTHENKEKKLHFLYFPESRRHFYSQGLLPRRETNGEGRADGER